MSERSFLQPDLIVIAEKIRTVEPGIGEARALAAAAGRFVFAGSQQDALALRGPETEIVDFKDATIMPGIVDAHVHLSALGGRLETVDLSGARSFDEAVQRTAAFAKMAPDGWLIGEGWDHNLWPGKMLPVHDALSAAVPDRPVLLRRVDQHALLLNARAMEAANVTSTTPDPAGGRIVRHADGRLTGVFVDNALDLVYPAVPKPNRAQLVRWLRAACREANRFGITAVGEARTFGHELSVLEELARDGALSLRVHAMISAETDLLEEHLARGPSADAYAGHLSMRAFKLFADGALGSHGAAMLEPYNDEPENRGLELSSQAHVASVTQRALARGFQVCVHAIGDRANRTTLDAFEEALRTSPTADHRLRIEHAQVLSPQDVPRFKSLGVIPSVQTSHRISDVAWIEERLGFDRARNAFPWRSLLDTGSILANGTDAPVEPIDPRRTFCAAMEGMSREEALRSMTIWAAYANFSEHAIGSIAPGKYADFVVVDRDWLQESADAIAHTQFLATYSAGRRLSG